MEQPAEFGRPWSGINLSPEKIKRFFVTHLDRIYAAKIHLFSKLPELREEAEFVDLKQAIDKTLEDVEKQINRMQMIYTLLEADMSTTNVNGLSGLIDDAFDAISNQKDEPALQDLSIIFYLQNIESIEVASFQILQMAAVNFNDNQIRRLLKENYEDAKAGRALLLFVSSKYMNH